MASRGLPDVVAAAAGASGSFIGGGGRCGRGSWRVLQSPALRAYGRRLRR
jgi:hypothetical protein